MKQRCEYPKHNRYKNYGGRGVRVDWIDFESFYNDMNESYESHCSRFGERNTSIDRIDVHGNYCRENCRWSTLWSQNLNRTNNRLLTYRGQTKTLSEWSRDKKIPRASIQTRLNGGWSIDDALEKPLYTVINRRKLTDEHKDKIRKSMLSRSSHK